MNYLQQEGFFQSIARMPSIMISFCLTILMAWRFERLEVFITVSFGLIRNALYRVDVYLFAPRNAEHADPASLSMERNMADRTLCHFTQSERNKSRTLCHFIQSSFLGVARRDARPRHQLPALRWERSGRHANHPFKQCNAWKEDWMKWHNVLLLLRSDSLLKEEHDRHAQRSLEQKDKNLLYNNDNNVLRINPKTRL